MKRIITFSFDDGTMQDKRLIAMLDHYGLRGTFNLNSGAFGTVHNIVHDNILCNHDEVCAADVPALYANQEVAVHTVHHPNLLTCDDDRVRYEIAEDKRALEALTGQRITVMAYPGGPYFDERIIRIAQSCGIQWARATVSTHRFDFPENFMAWDPSCWIEDPGLFVYLEQFLEADAQTDLLFYVWAHSFEFDKYRSWDRAEAFFAAVAAKKDRLICMTNGEVYRYRTGSAVQ